MAAYRADIEIGVVGAARLKELQDRITKLSRAIDDANVKTFIDNKAVQSLGEYSGAAGKAAANLRETAIQLNAAGKASGDYANAISQLVTAVEQENSALKIQNNLIKEEIELRRKAKLAASGIRETTQYAGPIGPGQASPVGSLVGQKSPVEERIRRTLAARKEELNLQEALLRLEEKSSAEFNKQLEARKALAQTAAIEVRSLIARAAAGPQASQLLLAAAAPGAPAMGGGARRRITGQVERLGGARTADEAAATLRLAQATDALVQSSSKIDPQYNRFLPDTAALNAVGRGITRLTTNQEEFNQTVQRGIRFEEKYNQELERRQRLGIGGPVSNRMPGTTKVTRGPFPVEGPIPLSEFGRREVIRSRGAGLGNRVGGAISGSIIGGAFPLLFGQGGGAAAGGAIGGLVGGLAGPGGSFAGSLLGTLLGDIASRGQAVKQLGEDLGFSATQASTLADAFKTANTDVEKFTAVVQNIRGVGLELEEQATAVQLVTALTEKYGGTFEKVGNALTTALESGKVSQAVLNQLTSQGITVQDALAAKYDVSRDKILEMAKKGEISVQSLLDTLVELGNASTEAAEKTQTPFEKALLTTGQLFQSFWKDVQAIFAGVSSNGVEAGTALLNIFNKLLQEVLFPLGRFLARIVALFVDVVSTGARAAVELINGFRGVSSAIGDALIGVVNMIPGLRTIVGLARQLLKGATGSKSSDWNDMPWPEGIPKPGSPGMIGKITAPSQALPTGTKGSKGPKPPEDRTAKLREDLNAMRLISTTEDGIRDALFQGNKALAIQLEYDQKVYDIKRDTAKALIDANYESEKTVLRAQEIVRLKDAELVRQDRLRDLIKEQAEALNAQDPLSSLQQEINLIQAKLEGKEQEYLRQKQINELFDQKVPLADAISQVDALRELNVQLQQQLATQQLLNQVGQATSSLFESLITSTDSWSKSLSNALRSLASLLLQAGLQGLAADAPGTPGRGFFSFLTGGIGKRAEGGPVSAGSPYIVGERGPELFVPGRSGGIVPNEKLGGDNVSVVVNVDAKGTNVQGNDQQGNQLGRAISAAVQQELIKQKRPGGLLA